MSYEYFDSIWEQLPEHRHEHHGSLAALAADFAAGAERVLDLGCGDGRHFEPLASGGARVSGADRSAVALERAAHHAAAAALPAPELVEIGPDERLPLADNRFDRVWCCGMLEHVVDTQTVLSEIRRVLSPGGELMVVTPQHGLRTRLRLVFGGWDRHFDPFSSRLRFYTGSSLAHALTECGFESPELSVKDGLIVALSKRL